MDAEKGVQPKRQSRIPKASHPSIDDSPLHFSFKHIDLDSNTKFKFCDCPTEFLYAFFSEIKRMSSWSVAEFCEFDQGRHSHFINFDETTEPDGFPSLGEQLDPEVFWQFSIDHKKPWRVHGFFLDSTFFIVWLDPQHRLDSKSKA